MAAQLANEFRQFFPNNRVEYFVSYYDYYQPEAYIAQTDTFIEKESTVNDEIDRLRHAATAALAHADAMSSSWRPCQPSMGSGSPEHYGGQLLTVGSRRGVPPRLRSIKRLVNIQYDRNEVSLTRGTFQRER